MQLLQFVLAFTILTFASAIPQSPVGSSGSGDTGGTNSGDDEGSAAATSSATQSSSTSSKSSTATSSPASTASTKSGAVAMLSSDWSIAGGLVIAVGGAAVL